MQKLDFPNMVRQRLFNRHRLLLIPLGTFYGEIQQNVAFANVAPEELVLDWIIDDGQLLDARPHRRAIFSSSVKVVGIASGPNPAGRVVCCLLGEDYDDTSSSYGQTTTHTPSHVAPQTHHAEQPTKVYPNYEVFGLNIT